MPITIQGMGQNKLPTTFRVKEGGIERFVVELIKMGGRVKHARIVSVETQTQADLPTLLSSSLYLSISE